MSYDCVQAEFLRSKAGQRHTNLPKNKTKLCLWIVQNFQIALELKFVKILNISSSTLHVIIKIFLEKSLCARDRAKKVLQGITFYCIKNRRESVTGITVWDREHFQKQMSVNTVCCVIHKCRLELCYAKKRNPVMQSSSLSQSSFAMDLAKVKNCSVVLNQTIHQTNKKSNKEDLGLLTGRITNQRPVQYLLFPFSISLWTVVKIQWNAAQW